MQKLCFYVEFGTEFNRFRTEFAQFGTKFKRKLYLFIWQTISLHKIRLIVYYCKSTKKILICASLVKGKLHPFLPQFCHILKGLALSLWHEFPYEDCGKETYHTIHAVGEPVAKAVALSNLKVKERYET